METVILSFPCDYDLYKLSSHFSSEMETSQQFSRTTPGTCIALIDGRQADSF